MMKLAPLSQQQGSRSLTANPPKNCADSGKISQKKLKTHAFEMPTIDDKFFGSSNTQNTIQDEILTSRVPNFIESINAAQKLIDENLYTMIMNMAKYTQKLENIIRFKNREIERLEYLNKYLVVAQEKRDEILKHTLEENRKLKESTIRADRFRAEKKHMNKFQSNLNLSLKHNNNNNNFLQNKSILNLGPISVEDSQIPSIGRISLNRNLKNNLRLAINQFDEKKNQSILLLSEADTHAKYRENERLKFLENLIKDDEYFIHEISNFDQPLFISLWEAIQFIITDHRNLLFLVLKMKQLIKSAGIMTTSLVLMESIERLIEETCDCLDCERASVFIYDQSKQELWSKIAKGTDLTIRVPANKGIVGHVFTKGETLNIPDAYHDERFNKDNDLKSGYKTNTILCVPINDSANHPIGVVQAINKKGTNAVFNKDDEGLLLILANLAGTILRNSMSFNETIMFHNNLRLCLRVGIELNSYFDLIGLINQAQKKLKIIMGGDKAKIILKNEEKGELFALNSEGQIETYPINCGIAGYAIELGEMESIPNAYTHYLFNGRIDLETSLPLICQPIKNPETEKVIGAFEVINIRGLAGVNINQKPKITPYDMETLEFFSKQFGRALCYHDDDSVDDQQRIFC